MAMHLEPIESKDTWEEFLLTHSPQALFQSWLWGEVQEKAGLTVFRFGLYDSEALVGIAQMFLVKAKRGSFLHVRHGPVFVEQRLSYWQAFIELVRQFSVRQGALFFRVNPLIESSDAHEKLLRSQGFVPAAIHAMDAELCWVLDLDPSEDVLLAQMRKTTRYEVRRAQKLEVRISTGSSAEELKEFFSLYEATSKRHHFVPHTGIQEEFDVFTREDKALLFLAKHENQTIAGALVLFYGNQGIYHHGASIESRVPGSYLIQWEAIREAKKRGMKVYNFWGIAPEGNTNHPWRGITLFKKGFGGRQVEYIHAHDYPVSRLYVVPKAVESVRRILKGY